MSTLTSNLGLIKPDATDNYSIDVLNSNADMIDAELAKQAIQGAKLEPHIADTTTHVTATERAAWNAKVDISGTVANATNASNADTLDGKHASEFLQITGGEVNGGITAQSFEAKGGTPFIDFHFNNSTKDYTTRIIEVDAGVLLLIGNLLVNDNQVLHKGNSVPVVVSSTAPTDTTALWIQ